MKRSTQQFCFLNEISFKSLFKVSSFKCFYLHHLAMLMLFSFGGDVCDDFMDKDHSVATAASVFYPRWDLLKSRESVTALLTSPTDYFRSRQNGDWSIPATWESSADNINWQLATVVPTKDANTITIQNGHIVSVTNSVSLDQTVIGGILELQTGGILNINDGVGDDVAISGNGVLQIVSTNTYLSSIKQSAGANINISTGGKIIAGNGITSIGNGYEGFATSTINNWNDGAIYEWNNNLVFVIGNLIYFPNAGATIPIFRITKVGAAASSSNDFHLNGMLEINSNVTFAGTGKKYFRNGIRGNATLTQTGTGNFFLTDADAVLGGTALTINLSAVFHLSPISTIVPSGANVNITGANLSNSDGFFTISGILDLTTQNVTNPNGHIILNGIYKTSHPGGFSGIGSSIPSPTGSISVNPGSTIELYASGDQLLNARADFSNLIFSGSGVKTASTAFYPNGTVTIKDEAIFDCKGHNVGDASTNLTMKDDSRLIADAIGTQPSMDGSYNLTGGVIEFRGSNLTAQTIRNKIYQNIEITGNNVKNSNGNILLNANGTFVVKPGAIFTMNDNSIMAAGTTTGQKVIVETNGLFRCGSNEGFNGFSSTLYNFSSIHSNISNIILQDNSTIEYSRSSPPLSNGDQNITNANGLIYQNLILSGTGNKTAPAGDLIIQGNLSKTGSCNFLHNNGTVIFNGYNAQTYLSSSPQMVFNSLTNNNVATLNINDSLSIYKKLLLGNNSKLNVNADITLLSDKNQTANVAPIPTSAVINYGVGRFIVERYISTNTIAGGHAKSWQFISTPAFGETIFNTWQEKRNNTIFGYGTWITDPSGTDNGFDAISYAPSMKYYDPATDSWIGIPNTNINLDKEKGYLIFVRGDRSATNLNSPATPTKLRTRGKLYAPFSGFLPPVIDVPAGKFQSIGNPYASVIDFTKINRSSEIENSFIVWDPLLAGYYGYGGYQTITPATNFRAVPGGTNFYNTSDDYRNIQSGQAFFVHNPTAVLGSVTFSETSKTDAGNHLVNRDPPPGELFDKQFLFANLYEGDEKIADGNAIVYGNQFSNKIDRDDAMKINNSGANFGIKREGKILAVETRHTLQTVDTIFYDMRNLVNNKYRLMFVPENMHEGKEAFLIDQYLKSETPVSLSDTTFTDFLVTDNATSAKPDRFMLVFRQPAVSFVSIKAFQKDENVFVEWKVVNENNVKQYVLEHSVDGIHFSEKIIIKVDNNLKGEYSFKDSDTVEGINYYRIISVADDDKKIYSTIVKILIEGTIPQLSVYPNPLQGDHINLQFLHQPAGTYQVRLLNSSGQLIMKKEMNHQNDIKTETIQLNNSMAHGVYQLEIIKPDGQKKVIKVTK